MYDAQASSIKIEDITTNEGNRMILKRMRRNKDTNIFKLYMYPNIRNQPHNEDDCNQYVPEGANDMGWLGYFIGKSNDLKELYIRNIYTSNVDVIKSFFSGVSSNKSIQKLEFFAMDLLGGKIFTMLDHFFKDNISLEVLTINGCNLGEDWRLLALVLGSCSNSLTALTLLNNNISDEGLVDIITALSMHRRLSMLDLEENCLHQNGCIALATLLKCSVTGLQSLDLSTNELDDECVGVLVPVLKNYSHLELLRLSNNTSITSRGWQKLASILESPNFNLKELILYGSNVDIDDKALAAFANSLATNRIMHTLNLNRNGRITDEGWEVLSKSLSDTSSINSTFLSNHTLRFVGGPNARNVPLLRPMLTLNLRDEKREVAIIKILQHHNCFDMTPFFEWEFKVLPLMIGWFERASVIDMPKDYEPDIEPRKLSSIYQFIRAMPLLYVETYLMKELEDIKAAQKQKEEELVILEERKKSIMKRLGKQRGAPGINRTASSSRREA